MQLIDLSVVLNEQTPVYPGDPVTKIEPAGILEKDGYTDHEVTFATHVGTHIDAPSHMVQGKTLDQFPLDKFWGRGICVEVPSKFDVALLKQVDIKAGDIVLFYTKMIEQYHDPAYYEDFPIMTEDVANYLVQKKVKMVGMDMCGPDKAPFPIHRILLSAEILIIENLTNLNQLVGADFEVCAFPVKLELDGAPVRVVAELR